MKTRVLVIVATFILTLGLVAGSIALAQNAGQEQPADESAAGASRELLGPAVVTAQLFVGVSDPAISTYLIDPTSGTTFPQFSGLQVWGATYDPDSSRVLFSGGSTLFEWPAGGTPAALGTVTSSVSDAPLPIVALAYTAGTLYGVRHISSADDPEGIYEIDLATLQATLAITYDVGPANVDIGGLDADPNSGILYGTNDGSNMRGLVQIDLDGTLTLIAPYPEGELDLDGLAVSDDGRAFLVPDVPGDIYVYDFGTMTYTTPITGPWTTSETYSAAAWITEDSGEGAAISLAKTVGTDPNACASTAEITIPVTAEVTYCYEVTNTGTMTLTLHDLEDSELGAIETGLSLSLSPGGTAFLTETVAISATTVNTATWTAYNAGPTDVVTATDSATVTIGALLPPEVEVTPGSLSEVLGENDQSSDTLTINNAGEAELEWSIEEAPAACDTPGDVPWLSVSPLTSTTAGGSDSPVDVTYDATGLVEGEYTGVLCIATNDPDEALVSVPITLTVISNQLYLPSVLGSPEGNP
jgi:hypothetical protein